MPTDQIHFTKVLIKMTSIRKIFHSMIEFMKFFGFAAFKYPSNEFKISVVGTATCLVNVIINVYQAYSFLSIAVVILKSPLPRDVLVIHMCLFISVFFGYLILILSLVFCLILKKSLFDLINKFTSFDDEVRK